MSGHGHAGTMTGPDLVGAGHSGGALVVRRRQRLRAASPTTPTLDLTTGMTLEAWVRPSALGTAWRTVLFKEQAATWRYALYANTSTGRPTGQVYVGGQRDARGTAALAPARGRTSPTTYDGSDPAPVRQRRAGRDARGQRRR